MGNFTQTGYGYTIVVKDDQNIDMVHDNLAILYRMQGIRVRESWYQTSQIFEGYAEITFDFNTQEDQKRGAEIARAQENFYG